MAQSSQPSQNSGSGMTGGGSEGKNIGMAIVAYILFFIPLLMDAKNDPFVKYHTRQGLLVLLVYVLSSILSYVHSFWWLSSLVGLFGLVLMIIGIINAANGKQTPLPLIGQLAENFKF